MELQDSPCTSVYAAIAVVLLTVIYYFVKHRNILPGPKGVPYLGLYPFLKDENVHLQLDQYKKEYGDLFSFTYSGRLFINMGSVKVLRELHLNNSDCFTDRFGDFNILAQMLGNGLVMINGEPWKVLRKYFIQRFRDYGLNTVRDNMAGPVYDSLSATIEDLKTLQGNPFNVVDLIAQRSGVTLRKIIFGEDGISDEELLEMTTLYAQSLEGMMGINLLLIGPFARFKFATDPKLRRSMKNHRANRKLFLSCIKRIERAMNEEHPSCIIEDFYKERNERQRNNDPTWKVFTDESLVDTLMQFVGDGITAVAAFIGGFLNTLIMYQEEQDKLYAELMEVVGPNRQPVLEDKTNLPYVTAFMNECLRAYSFLKMFPSLQCTKETTIRGYRIPKGSITLINFWSAHHDPDTFEDPDTFNPSRYMSNPEKPKAEQPVTFGIGKRSCSGESFVMMQSFLFLTTIIKNFKVTSSSEPSNVSSDFILTGKLELILSPRVEN